MEASKPAVFTATRAVILCLILMAVIVVLLISSFLSLMNIIVLPIIFIGFVIHFVIYKRRKTATKWFMSHIYFKYLSVIILAVVTSLLFVFVSILILSPNFIGPAPLSNIMCVAAPGYSCEITAFSGSSGNIVATIGQHTGSNWVTANVVFLNASVLLNASDLAADVSNPNFYQNNSSQLGAINNGTTTVVQIPMSSSGKVTAGTLMCGQLWVQYTTSAVGTDYYAEIAEICAKAT
jgi:hypothetical protein